MEKRTRGQKVGEQTADSLIEFMHLMYQVATANRVLNSLITILNERKYEFIRLKWKKS
jgi:hypothetical protein